MRRLILSSIFLEIYLNNFITSVGFFPMIIAAVIRKGTVGNTGRISPTAPIMINIPASIIRIIFKFIISVYFTVYIMPLYMIN